jgi:hypothetical protein
MQALQPGEGSDSDSDSEASEQESEDEDGDDEEQQQLEEEQMGEVGGEVAGSQIQQADGKRPAKQPQLTIRLPLRAEAQ